MVNASAFAKWFEMQFPFCSGPICDKVIQAYARKSNETVFVAEQVRLAG